MVKMKDYQESAIKQLITHARLYIEINKASTIVFQSPTGSGKTFMMTKFISQFVEEMTDDVCFLWVSIGTGGLHEQSYKSVKRNITPKIQCSLLESEFFGSRDSINNNEIVFLNWEKIRNKNNGVYTNSLMKDKDTYNFPDVLNNTRKKGTKIVLIIDECHRNANTPRALELRDEIIVPHLTIEMSATPKLLSNMDAKVIVNPYDVINEGMIKKEVLINEDLDKITDNEIYSEALILESAYRKRIELKNEFNRIKTKVNPLVLIQLPNSDYGDTKKMNVLKFLDEKGLTTSNGTVAVWLSNEKINIDDSVLNENNSKVEFLLFKQAIDTGWNCPRAYILVKFRESNNITFEIQTVGRILRMPEAKHYDNEKLDASYVYTNFQSINIKREEYNLNIIKNLCSKRIENYQKITLQSFYKNRIDFGDITSQYVIFFEKKFCNYFNINQNDTKLSDYDSNKQIMIKKGVIFDNIKLDSIICNIEIRSENIDTKLKIDNYDHINVIYSTSDLEEVYNTILADNLNGFAPKRSIPVIKKAILKIFREYLNIKPANGGIEYIQRIIVANKDHFSKIINDAVIEFKNFKQEDIKKKTVGKYNPNWEIPISRNYNPENSMKIESTLSVLQPCYLPLKGNKEANQLEIDFISYLEKNKKQIEWFWKNGDEHVESNFGIKKEDGYTFQPDFIVLFKDKKIGIFDTKDIYHNAEDNVDKSNALYKYICDERFKGRNIIGGLVIKDQYSNFRYYFQAQYHSFKDNPEMWESMDDLINEKD